MITTNMSAAVGGITWTILDYRHEKKFSALGFCCGMICGLVAITPASGYVSPSSSLIFGFLGAVVCNFSLNLKNLFKIDDAFDVFVVHGVGGIVGNLLTGIFAQKSVAAVDGQIIKGGWLDENWEQLGIQALHTIALGGWAFVMTTLILFVIDKTPGLSLRANEEIEQSGLDQAELGFSMYEHIEDVRFMNSTVCILPNGDFTNSEKTKEKVGEETTENL